MKTTNDINTARIRKIAENVRNWDMEDVHDLSAMLRDIEERLRGTGHVLRDFVDLETLPSMPRPPHGYTRRIWAYDLNDQALVGARADRIVSVYEIVLSRKYKKAKQIFTDIMYWDEYDVADLRDLFAALRATFYDKTMALGDIVKPEYLSWAPTPAVVHGHRIWAVDSAGKCLIGENGDDIRDIADIAKDFPVIGKARQPFFAANKDDRHDT